MVGFEVGLGSDWGGFRLMRWIRNSSTATENSFEFEMHLQNEMETLTLIELLNPTPPMETVRVNSLTKVGILAPPPSG